MNKGHLRNITPCTITVSFPSQEARSVVQLSRNTEQMLRNCWGGGGERERKGSNPIMDWHPNWLEVVTSLLHFMRLKL